MHWVGGRVGGGWEGEVTSNSPGDDTKHMLPQLGSYLVPGCALSPVKILQVAP